MKVLIACEFSGIVRDAFVARGHDAWSCDLLPGERSGGHFQCNVLSILKQGWDLMIAHPPCTYLTVTANKWMKPEFRHRFPDRPQQREQAVEFFMSLILASVDRIAVENPVGIMSTRFRKPNQIIQPYQFGHAETKKTCLWLKNLPCLIATNIVEPVFYHAAGKPYSPTHYMSTKSLRGKCHLDMLPPMKDRWKIRSRTFQGVADAMAAQWG